jgi:hypothetical protein
MLGVPIRRVGQNCTYIHRIFDGFPARIPYSYTSYITGPGQPYLHVLELLQVLVLLGRR